MIIVLAGPSGSGKTTIARMIEKHHGFKFTENSAGLIMNDTYKENLARKYGYTGNSGQLGVYHQSITNPQFGKEFQFSLLESRLQLLDKALIAGGDYVWDRSILDPLVYSQFQASHQMSDGEYRVIHNTVLGRLKNYGLIINTHVLPFPIEDNGSRHPLLAFQTAIDHIFSGTLNEYLRYTPGKLKERIIDTHHHRIQNLTELDEWVKGYIGFRIANYKTNYEKSGQTVAGPQESKG